jgi:DNA-binding LacI/PurR family transcriptional regulator
MTDVAKLAGVSHQTVSRVLNGHPNVREQTRLRVRAAIAELGYRPNSAARALVTGRTQVIGVIAQSSTLFGPATTLDAITQAAIEHGFTVSVVIIRNFSHQAVTDAVNRHLDQRVAGLAMITPVVIAAEALSELTIDVPLVTVDGDPARTSQLVSVDQEAGGYLATRHLLDAGHDTVWHVCGPEGWYDSMGRIEGWRRALTEAGAEIPPLLTADWSAAAGYRVGRMLARMTDVTAVFAANDHLALGIMRALSERGRQVPHDLSLVGFDDVPEAEFYTPPLTTIRPDFEAVAAASIRMLLAQIGPAEGATARRIIQPALISRGSVAPPPALPPAPPPAPRGG